MTPEEKRKAYVSAARAIHEAEGTLEIDDNAEISEGGNRGAYVQAWVWVYKSAVPEFQKEGSNE